MERTDKNVTVVGLARSGAGAACLLAARGASVTVTDSRPPEALADALALLPASVRLFLGGHPDEAFDSADLIVVSPGVPLTIGPLQKAAARGTRIVGELELAYRAIEDGTLGSGAIPFLAITGSNGKSTTTTLLDDMMRRSGCLTLFGGNIGNALSGEILKLQVEGLTPGAVVAEISSFQLEAIETFRPHIAAILNITPDHLDRYHSMEEYGAAKAAIFRNQQESDHLVLNADDPGTADVWERASSRRRNLPEVVFFSRERSVKGLYLKDGAVMVNIPELSEGVGEFRLIDCSMIGIKGVHNLENAMAASAMALLAGCPVEAVRRSLIEFPGLEHRLEPVRELEGVKYVNDSKGTNVGAVLKSIESYAEPLILIAGGRDKAGDFSALAEAAAKKVKALVLIGEAAEKIEKAMGGCTRTIRATSLREAVAAARAEAEAGDVVLLSPACASFDMFRDFEDRGEQFKTLVRQLEAVHA